jgi:hypothetical protein
VRHAPRHLFSDRLPDPRHAPAYLVRDRLSVPLARDDAHQAADAAGEAATDDAPVLEPLKPLVVAPLVTGLKAVVTDRDLGHRYLRMWGWW